MKVNKLLTFFLILVMESGCINMRRDQYGRALPRYPKWSLKKNAGDVHSILRHDVVYVRESDDRFHPGYQIIRFWPSGHYMAKLVSKLESDELNSHKNASVGYYQTLLPNHIMVEIYTTINFGQYGYIKYRLDTNGDLLELSSGPSWTWWHYKYPEPLRFIPQHVGELKLQPDW